VLWQTVFSWGISHSATYWMWWVTACIFVSCYTIAPMKNYCNLVETNIYIALNMNCSHANTNSIIATNQHSSTISIVHSHLHRMCPRISVRRIFFCHPLGQEHNRILVLFKTKPATIYNNKFSMQINNSGEILVLPRYVLCVSVILTGFSVTW
jgi:hypothetical protein